MAEVQEQFEQATQQPQLQPQPKKANWWKRGVLIVAGGLVLTIGGCSTLVGLAALGAASDTGNAQDQPVNTEEVADGEQPEAKDSLQGPATPSNPNSKEVKVVVTSPDEPADYSAMDDRFKINDMQQISGTETFRYTLPAKDGLMVTLRPRV